MGQARPHGLGLIAARVTDSPAPGLSRDVGLRSATLLVVAGMIGAGIFTTTGFMAQDLGHPAWILLLWAVGGVMALCGALCFAELGAMMPEAGAEYVYLRESYGPTLAFMGSFVALLAGFSAPIAAVLKSLVRYLGHFIPVLADDPRTAGLVSLDDLVAIGFVWALVAIHARGLKSGLGFTDLVTAMKVLGIVALIGAAIIAGKGAMENIVTVSPRYAELGAADLASTLATSLIFVNFCYLGWNGAAYMAGEMKNPQRHLPLALLLGTGGVTLLYMALNVVYLYGAGVDGLAGAVEVGLVASQSLFGPSGTTAIAALMCVTILSSASAMTAQGPRVYYAAGRDVSRLAWLARISPRTSTPVNALILQGAVTTAFILSGRVDQILQYAGFTATLFATLPVSSVIYLRIRRPDAPRPFRAWGYPFTPLLFLGVSTWTMVWAVRGRPLESMLGLATAALGAVLFVGLTRTRSR